MKKITVNASINYDIIVDHEIISECGKYINEVVKPSKIAVITDDNVDKYYGETVVNSLKKAGFQVTKFVFKHGEEQKSHKTLIDLYDFLVNNQITRSDCLVALGGGVVGDLTGFAAATYLRGIDFIQIPTSLLAQVDSSVGGKTGIDISSGKNLVGAFKQPKLVLCDISALNTLTDEYFSDGMGEVIKYGMIISKELFDIISKENIKNNPQILEDIICRCIKIKRDVVEADEFDKGERMLLNYGHTLGHAIEKAGSFTEITHGKGVGIGMALITKLCLNSDLCNQSTYDKLISCLKVYDIPYETKYNLNELAEISLSDKKRSGDSINLIICTDIGKSEIKKMSIEEYLNFINGGENGR